MTYVRLEGPTTATQNIVGIVQTNADYFGASLAASEDYLVVGAPGTHKIYIYERDVLGAWVEVLEVTQVGNHGMSVDLMGDVIAVGGHRFTDTDTDQGKVWIYRRVAGTWTLVQEILSPHVATYGYFGKAVALSADAGVLIVGQPDLNGNRRAYAYHYNSGTGLYEHKTTLSDAASLASGAYGSTVAVNASGTRVVAGAKWHNPGGSTNRGAAWVWDYDAGTDAWSMTQKLSASDGATTDYFGTSVALIGDTIAVSAPGHDSAGSDWGAVYIYEYSGGVWAESHKEVPAKRLNSACYYMGGWGGTHMSSLHEHFKMVFVDASRLLVSSIWDLAAAAQNPGSLRLITATGGWSAGTEQSVLVPINPAYQSLFGRCCMSGDKLIVSRLQGGHPVTTTRGVAYEYGTVADAFGVSAAFIMQGYRPGTADFETWIAGSPSMVNPSGAPIIDVKIQGIKR